jgi:hypothetical protein
MLRNRIYADGFGYYYNSVKEVVLFYNSVKILFTIV